MTGTVVRHLSHDRFRAGLRDFFSYRDLGVRDASGGRVGAHVIRAVPGAHSAGEWHLHAVEFQMVYVLKGWVEFEYEDIGVARMEAGTNVYQPPRIRHREVRHSEDLEMLEITMPAVFETELIERPERAASTAN